MLTLTSEDGWEDDKLPFQLGYVSSLEGKYPFAPVSIKSGWETQLKC